RLRPQRTVEAARPGVEGRSDRSRRRSHSARRDHHTAGRPVVAGRAPAALRRQHPTSRHSSADGWPAGPDDVHRPALERGHRPGLHNDSLPPDDFRAFLDGFVGAVKGHIDGDVYCVLGASEWPTLDWALRQHDFHWSATIIWVKDVFVLGRSKYHRRYEPIWYGWQS